METEDRILARFEAELATIAALDRLYYLNLCPSADDRREYAARQIKLEGTRFRFYAELAYIRRCRQLRRCRSIIHRSQRDPVHPS